MKKVIIVLSLSIMASCTSNEKKAEDLIKDKLISLDSYEPISTKVDSAFIDMAAIDPIIEICHEINNLTDQMNICEQYEEKTESYLYDSARKLSEKLASLKENVARYYKGEFTGWKVSHSFRYLNRHSYMSLNRFSPTPTEREMIFFCDKEFTDCFGYDADGFEIFTEILKAVNESTSDEDLMNDISTIAGNPELQPSKAYRPVKQPYFNLAR